MDCSLLMVNLSKAGYKTHHPRLVPLPASLPTRGHYETHFNLLSEVFYRFPPFFTCIRQVPPIVPPQKDFSARTVIIADCHTVPARSLLFHLPVKYINKHLPMIIPLHKQWSAE